MSAPPASRSPHVRGIVTMLCAVAVFAVMDATMKELARTYPTLQVSALRALASLPFLLAVIAISNRWRELTPRRWGLHLTRGALAWQPSKRKRNVSGALRAYASLTTSAARGAIREIRKVRRDAIKPQ